MGLLAMADAAAAPSTFRLLQLSGRRNSRCVALAQPQPRTPTKKLHRTWTPGRRVSTGKRYPIIVRQEEEQEDGGDSPAEPRTESGTDEPDSDSPDEDDDDQFQDQLNHGEEEMGGSSSSMTTKASQLNCLHFPRCSGCAFENGLNNPPVLKEAAPFFEQRHVHDFRLVPSATTRWRCRAKLAVRGTAEEPLIGLFEEHTHNVVDIPECRAHHPSLNAVVELIREAIREFRVQPYDEATASGQLRYIQVVLNTYNTTLPAEERYRNGRVQVTLVWNARDERSRGTDVLHAMAESLWKQGGDKSSLKILHSVWANFQTTQTNVILGQRWRRLFGEEELWERFGGVDICYTPSSFAQANYQAFEDLLRRLQGYVRKGSAVADLYAGVGVIGLSLAASRKCRLVKCVEVNKHCRAPFERSLERFPKAQDCQISWHCADATEAPITWLEGSDVVIVDPPRKGLEPSVIEALRTASLRAQGKTRSPSLKDTDKIEKRPWILRAQQDAVQRDGSFEAGAGDGIWPERLIYVSCAWDAFQEDCKALEHDGRWHLERAHAFNFFPGTNSIEILAVFKVGKRSKKEKQASKKRSSSRRKM